MINVLEGIRFSVELSEADVDEVVIPINFHLVTHWWRDEFGSNDEYEVRVRLISPAGEDLGGTNLKLSFKDSQSSRHNVNIQGFPYKGDGVYRYVVFQVMDGEQVEVQQIPIPVERIPFQENQDPPAD